jgi:hypothetical protein
VHNSFGLHAHVIIYIGMHGFFLNLKGEGESTKQNKNFCGIEVYLQTDAASIAN